MSRRSRAEWKALMLEHEETEMTVAEFAQSKGVKKESFRWWRKVFRREERREREAAADAGRPLTARIVDRLASAPSTTKDLAESLGMEVENVTPEIDELVELGMIYSGERKKGGAPVWHLG